MMSAIRKRGVLPQLIAAVAMCVAVSAGVGEAASPANLTRGRLTDSVHDDDVVFGEYVVMLRSGPADGMQARADDSAPLSSRIDAVMSRLAEKVGRAGEPAVDRKQSREGAVIVELPVVGGFGARLTSAEVAALGSLDEVLSIEPNSRIRVNESTPASTVTPMAGPSELPWGLDRIDQPDLPLDRSFAPDGDGSGVTVYVIDNGVWGEHQEFGGRAIEPIIDFIGDFPSPDQIDPACMNHGTHVAGTIAGTNVGVAPNARVRAVRVLGCDGTGTLIDMLRGMDWVAVHAKLPAVANMSLGGDRSSAVGSAVRYMTAKGITVVTAAGNFKADACRYSPAHEPSAITVGASDRNDNMATFSNVGSCLDVFAPGVDVVSASIDGTASYRSLDGTSMASPHVAGAAAAYLSRHRGATPDAVERAIVRGARADVLNGVTPPSPNRLLQVNDLPNPVNKPGTDPVAHIAPPSGTGPVEVGTRITLDGRGSFDPGGEALSYEWRVQGIDGIAGTGPTLSTVANVLGLFEATLKVTNRSGVTATATLQIEVAPPPPPVIVLEPSDTSVYAERGRQLSWDASASYDRGGGAIAFDWSFQGEGSLIKGTAPTFSTTFGGGYAQLFLTVTNEAGGADYRIVEIFEQPSPTATILPSATEVSIGEPVTLDGSQSTDPAGEGLSYAWRDQRSGPVLSTDSTYTRTFDRTGTFELWLTVTDIFGITDTAVVRIRVTGGSTSSSSTSSTTSSSSTTLVPPPPRVAPSALSAVEPVRVLDTRLRSSAAGRRGALGAGRSVRFTVRDIPADAVGAVLNVTAVNPSANGHLTVYPCGGRPATSNVNYRAGVTTANAVVSQLGAGRQMCVWSFATTDVVVDVTGYLPAGSAAHSISSVRAVDTRSESGGRGRLPAGTVLKVPVTSVTKVPADATAVFVNVTAANPAADGHLTVYRCGAVPGTSNVNYRAGGTKANMAVVQLAADGSLCVKSHAESDVVVDVLGYVDATGGVELATSRALDTRDAVLSGSSTQKGPVVARSLVKLDLDVDPESTAGVFLSVVAANPSGDGHLTVFPCGDPPTASVLNYRAGVTTSNMVFTKLDESGSVCVWTFATTDLVIDYNGRVAIPA